MYLNKNYNTLWNTNLSYSAHDRPCDIFLCFIRITSKMYFIMLLNDTSIHKAKLTKTCAVLKT